MPGGWYNPEGAGGGGGLVPTVEAFSKGGTFLSPAGAINMIAWRAPFACTVTRVRGYRVGGTGATVNARLNGASNHLAAALSLTAADTWMDGGNVQNTAYAAGDKLELMVVAVAGAPTQIGIQVEFTRDYGEALFTKGASLLNPAAINMIVWRCEKPCTVVNVHGYRVGGTGATVNARKNGALNHLAANLSLTAADTWMTGAAPANTDYLPGDKMEIMIVGVVAAPTQVEVLVEFEEVI